VSTGAQTLKYSRCRLGMGTGVGRPRPGRRVRGSTASLGSRLGSTRFSAPCRDTVEEASCWQVNLEEQNYGCWFPVVAGRSRATGRPAGQRTTLPCLSEGSPLCTTQPQQHLLTLTRPSSTYHSRIHLM
jgi:hypothetical protein